MPVRALVIVFMVLLGLAVTMAVQVVGTLLLFALVVTPAATAIMLTPRPAVGDGRLDGDRVVSVWLGLGLSAMFNLPPSFFIVTIACSMWFAVRGVSTVRARRTAEALGGRGGQPVGHAAAERASIV